MQEQVAVLVMENGAEPESPLLQSARVCWDQRSDPHYAQKLVAMGPGLRNLAKRLMQDCKWAQTFNEFNPDHILQLMAIATYLDFINGTDVGFDTQLAILGEVHEICVFGQSYARTIRSETGKRAYFQFLYLMTRTKVRIGACDEASRDLAQISAILSMYHRSPWYPWASRLLNGLIESISPVPA